MILSQVSAKALMFDFYGHVEYIEAESWNQFQLKSVSNKTYLQRTEYILESAIRSEHIQKIRELKAKFQLDDLGTVLLIQKIVARLSSDQNKQRMIEYVILKKLGYDVLCSYSSNDIFVYGVLSEHPAQSIYLNYNSKRYTRLAFHKLDRQGLCSILPSNTV